MTPPGPVRQLHVGDHGKDLDDEVSLLLSAALVRHGDIDLVGVVSNLAPAGERARLARGTVTMLGLDVPVATGTGCGWEGRAHAYEFDAPYLSAAADVARSGRDMIGEALSSGDLHLVLMSGFTDVAEVLEEEPGLFRTARSVTVMGGVDVNALEETGLLVPNHTANNDFDWDAAGSLYRGCQELGVPLRVLTRNAAAHALVPRRFYEDLEASGHAVGVRLGRAARTAMEQLWEQVNLPFDDPLRTLPPGPPEDPRDASWFERVFCTPGSTGEVWGRVRGSAQYDALTVVASVPHLAERFFTPLHVGPHSVVGPTPTHHGVKDADALVSWLSANALSALG